MTIDCVYLNYTILEKFNPLSPSLFAQCSDVQPADFTELGIRRN